MDNPTNDVNSKSLAGHIGELALMFGVTLEDIQPEYRFHILLLVILNQLLSEAEKIKDILGRKGETDIPSASKDSGINLHTDFQDFWNRN